MVKQENPTYSCIRYFSSFLQFYAPDYVMKLNAWNLVVDSLFCLKRFLTKLMLLSLEILLHFYMNTCSSYNITGGLGISSSKVYGTLDLGGGSTQITLSPVNLVCVLPYFNLNEILL